MQWHSAKKSKREIIFEATRTWQHVKRKKNLSFFVTYIKQLDTSVALQSFKLRVINNFFFPFCWKGSNLWQERHVITELTIEFLMNAVRFSFFTDMIHTFFVSLSIIEQDWNPFHPLCKLTHFWLRASTRARVLKATMLLTMIFQN